MDKKPRTEIVESIDPATDAIIFEERVITCGRCLTARGPIYNVTRDIGLGVLSTRTCAACLRDMRAASIYPEDIHAEPI